MTAQFLIDMDESIVSKARTPKGMRTLQAILDATYVLISTEGVAAASQEAIRQTRKSHPERCAADTGPCKPTVIQPVAGVELPPYLEKAERTDRQCVCMV